MGARDDIVRELSGCKDSYLVSFGGFYAQMLIPAPRSPRSGTLAISMIRNKKRPTAIVRPLAIGLIGLALAVVLWGIGYRLSLYRPHPDPSVRMGVAKLWVGSRKAVCVSNARTKLVAVTPDPQLLHDQNLTSPCNAYAFLESPSGSALSIRFRLLLRTLRSPPAALSVSDRKFSSPEVLPLLNLRDPGRRLALVIHRTREISDGVYVAFDWDRCCRCRLYRS